MILTLQLDTVPISGLHSNYIPQCQSHHLHPTRTTGMSSDCHSATVLCVHQLSADYLEWYFRQWKDYSAYEYGGCPLTCFCVCV